MNSLDSTKNQITQLLQSKVIENQLTAISHIRQAGDKFLLEQMLELLILTSNKDVEREILRCLCDIKDNSMLPIIIESCKNPRFKSKKQSILHCLWQTNFDMHAYIDYFISLILTESFEIGIEALTLIEVTAENLNNDEKKTYIELLNRELNGTDAPQIKSLLIQAIEILS